MSEEIIELPLLAKPRVEVVFVDTAESLADAVATLAKLSGPFALDAERASGFKYSQRAYLIQAYRLGSPIYLIDPIAISPNHDVAAFAELANLLATDEWILHAASQDIPCLRELGITPTKLFDTELGSRIAGLARVGLGAVTEQLMGVKLAKEHSAVDWSTRPLHDDWLTYAALDVDVLFELREQMLALLTEKNKLDWAAEEFAAVANMQPKPPKIDRWRGLTGIHEVKDTRGMAIARALWTAREALAEKLDVAPGRLVPDTSFTHLAKNPPKTKPELASDKAFVGRASRSYLDTWWEALQVGLKDRDMPPVKLPIVGIPNHRIWPNKYPEADARLKAVRAALTTQAEVLELPIENLITPDYVRQICWLPPEPLTTEEIEKALVAAGARNWQATLTAPVIYGALQKSTDEPQ
ncbi:HRDC domain-containing protein [Rhodoluna sp.]|uniref:HRDC domain-containing protein n=1 Tax=Rhodoluna sp. TaxID=1969481 RepID=UPI0025E4C001|nr:HRDC domain-containing protein [Rhodoluna sp.]